MKWAICGFTVLILCIAYSRHASADTAYFGRTLHSIRILGNKAFPKDTLIDVLDIDTTWPFRDTYSNALARKASARLKKFYYERGYADFELLDIEVTGPEDADYADMTFYVLEGERYTIRHISIYGLVPYKPLNRASIESTLAIQSGHPFNPRQSDSDRRSIEERYKNHGYRLAKVSVSAKKKQTQVDLRYAVHPGKKWKIGRIRFTGNDNTYDFVIWNELEIATGDDYSRQKIDESVDRLYKTGLFRMVRLRERENPNQAQVVDIHIKLDESDHKSIGFGFGYETFKKAYVLGVWETRNAFSRGASLRTEGSWAQIEREIRIIYSERNLLYRNLRLTIKPFWRKQLYIDRRLNNYGFNTLGVENKLSYPWTRHIEVQLGYDYFYHFKIFFDPESEKRSTAGTNEINFDKYTEHVASYGLSYSTRDNYLNPTKGWYIFFSNEFHWKQHHPKYNFYQLMYSTSYYYNLGYAFILAPKISAGVMIPYTKNQTILRIDRFNQGREFYLRGYPHLHFGPTNEKGKSIGGDRFYFGSLELRSPFVYYTQIVLFVDAGNLFLDAWSNAVPAYTPGIGLRIKTPVGPFRMDVGFIGGRPDWPKTANISFGLGQQF